MNIALPVKTPSMPNFIFAGEQQIAVADLTDAQVEEFIALWRQTFRQHVATRRANRDHETRKALRTLTEAP